MKLHTIVVAMTDATTLYFAISYAQSKKKIMPDARTCSARATPATDTLCFLVMYCIRNRCGENVQLLLKQYICKM